MSTLGSEAVSPPPSPGSAYDGVAIIHMPKPQEHRQLLKDLIEIFANPTGNIISFRLFGVLNPILENMGMRPIPKNGMIIQGDVPDILKNPVCKALMGRGFDGNFTNEVFKIHNAYKAFPKKVNLTLEEDKAADIQRLEFVKEVINFTVKRKSLAVSSDLNEEDISEINSFFLDVKVDLFVKCLTILTEITGDFRFPYKKKLGPDPFVWETFEHLGGILQYHTHETKVIIPHNCPKSQLEAFERFNAEYSTRKNIIKNAFINIRINDLPELLKLVEEMLKKAKDATYDEQLLLCPNINLYAIRAIVSRILDQENIFNLVMLCFNSPENFDDSTSKEVKHQESGRYLKMAGAKSDDLFSPTKLSEKIEAHAFLNRLIEIGEFCTGKYLSPDFQRLMNRDFFQCLVNIRNALAHQGTLGNKANLDKLLSEDLGLLEKIMVDEMPKLYERFVGLWRDFYNEFGYFDGDFEKFWQKIYDKEKQPRVAKENFSTEQNFVSRHVATNNKKLHSLIKNFFQGYAFLLPEDEKELKKLFKTAKHIGMFETAILDTRKKYPIIKTSWENDFPLLKHLYTKFYDAQGNYLSAFPLNLLERVKSAIVAIDNINEILFSRNITPFDGNYDEWISHNLCKIQDLSAPARQNYSIFNAIKYNVMLCLEHIDQLREKADVNQFDNYRMLGSEYETKLRLLRNYIIHGNRLLDPPKSHSKTFYNMSDKRNQLIINTAITLITEVKPELIQEKEKIEKDSLSLRATSFFYMALTPSINPAQSSYRSYKGYR